MKDAALKDLADSHLLQDVAKHQAMFERLTTGLQWINESLDRASSFARQVESSVSQFESPFDKMLLLDRSWAYIAKSVDDRARLLAAMERHQNDKMLLSVALPKRGWYLSGEEPCTLSDRLAQAVRDAKWDLVDQQMMEHLPCFDTEGLRQALAECGIPEYCINRICRVIKHHDQGNYEEATYLGVPLLDEVAKQIYGKTFTTKRRRRGDQSKPELALRTATRADLRPYCEAFVQVFGCLQEDCDPSRLADEDYWNRHAIVHGLMQRAMGIKDSAKCLMALQFLFLAQQDEKSDATVNASEESKSG